MTQQVGERVAEPTAVDVPELASWSRRVAAVLLDSVVLGAVLYVATGREPDVTVLPLVGGTDTWSDSRGAGWVVATLVVMGLLQGLTGATPGKRVVGISVVDGYTGRPVGFTRTALRWLAHVIDALLLVGYLRPLWDPRNRTFADSLLTTVVVRRQRASSVPAAAAVVVCTLAAALCLFESRTVDAAVSDPVTPCPGSRAVATFGASDTTATTSRLGIRRTTGDVHQVVVSWALSGDDGDLWTVRLTVHSPDGVITTGSEDGGPTVDAAGLPDPHGSGAVGYGGPWWPVDGAIASAFATVPGDPTGWSATSTVRDADGTVVGRCTAPVPPATHRA